MIAAAALLYLTVFTVSVRLDGTTVRLPAGSTVSVLFARGLVQRHSGDLVAAKDGKVLKAGAGAPPYVALGGKPLSPADQLTAFGDLVSHDGGNTVEKTRVATQPIDFPVRYQGTGPIQSVLASGTDGVAEVTVGVVSEQVVKKRVLVAAVAQVVRRMQLTTGAKVVALTFDDGPWPGSTLAILKILKQYGATATFFEIGRQARQQSSLSRAVAKAGMEMGNHSETHPLNLGRLSATDVAKQIRQAQADITKASGKAPFYFRPPGGNTTPAMYPVLTKLGLGWVQWDINTDDWKRPAASAIVSKVIGNVRPGSVVLMHDGGGDRSHTVAALPTILAKLKAMGYTFVPISALKSVPHRMG